MKCAFGTPCEICRAVRLRRWKLGAFAIFVSVATVLAIAAGAS